jgi:succinoglycan biosynthesis protein ExoA
MPSVSIIIPCFNEQATIYKLLEAIQVQTYSLAKLEVIIADGMSTDNTRFEIASFADTHPDLQITIVENLKRNIPAGLNCALKKARGEIIVRLDAHSIPHPNYIERCVADLEAGLGDNVGGIWIIRPSSESWIAQSIAIASSHPIGVGDARYRYAWKSGLVDTVPFGAFKRDLLALVGFFDETLLTNEDYEFNARIRKSGGRVWLNPSIQSIYFSRPTLSGLAKQYFRYGFWKMRMLLRYPDSLRWRQGLPPLFVISIVLLGFAGIFLPLARVLLTVESVMYAIVLILAGVKAALGKKQKFLVIGLPLAISCMHIFWGLGFLWSMIKVLFTIQKPENE